MAQYPITQIVIQLGGLSNDQIAMALFNRGGAKSQLGDNQEAISDFTAAIKMGRCPEGSNDARIGFPVASPEAN